MVYAVAVISDEEGVNFERLRYCSEITIDIPKTNIAIIVAILPKFTYFVWLDYLKIYSDKLELSIKRQNVHHFEDSISYY